MFRLGNSRYVPNPAGLKELELSPKSGRAMEEVAEKIAHEAQARGGRFTTGYGSQTRMIDGTSGARAGTDAPMAHWDEWGNMFRVPRAPLRSALAALGLLAQTKESPKP